SAPATASTLPCETAPPAPVEITATALSASSVTLSWVEETQPDSFTVFDGSNAVLTTHLPSATVTGLASASAHTFRVVAALPGGCGATPAGSAPTVTTAAGPDARPGTPAELKVASIRLGPDLRSATVVLAWTQPTGADPVRGYRIYEAARVLATSQTTTATVVLPDSG